MKVYVPFHSFFCHISSRKLTKTFSDSTLHANNDLKMCLLLITRNGDDSGDDSYDNSDDDNYNDNDDSDDGDMMIMMMRKLQTE